jgi:uncharacterized membrane protein
MVDFEEVAALLGISFLLSGTTMLGALIGGSQGIVAGAITGLGILSCFMRISVQIEHLRGKH